MNKKIIIFGAFLSTFILILVPSISCVNANIQNKNNSNIKNINFDDIKKIKRMFNSDCNCQKTAIYNNSKSWYPKLLCDALLFLAGILFLLAQSSIGFLGDLLYFIFWSMGDSVMFVGHYILHCDWYFPPLNKVFINNEQFLYNFIKTSYPNL